MCDVPRAPTDNIRGNAVRVLADLVDRMTCISFHDARYPESLFRLALRVVIVLQWSLTLCIQCRIFSLSEMLDGCVQTFIRRWWHG